MSIDSRPLLPRPSSDQLQRLRDQALARVLSEEQLAAPPKVTRRWGLTRLAFFTVGLFPAVRALAAGVRCSAPQYGAPMPPPKQPCPPDYSEPPTKLPAPVLRPAPGPDPATTTPAPQKTPAPVPAPKPDPAPKPTPA